MTEATAQPCTTWSYRLQHLSLNLSREMRFGRKVSQTLCNAEAFDQAEMDEWATKWGGPSKRHKARIAHMPPCTKCARKAAKL